MGFQSLREAYNLMGFSMGMRPLSIRGYRDEFDPLLDNNRAGRRNRLPRKYCLAIFDKFGALDLLEMRSMVAGFLGCESADGDTDESADQQLPETDSFAKRLITGRAAEAYFTSNYHKEPEFHGALVTDMTESGCGYDFCVRKPEDEKFLAVEVKGMRSQAGSVLLTNKEYRVADAMNDAYFLYVVKGFDATPHAVKFRNPLVAGLPFERIERKIISVSWTTRI